MKKLLTVVFTMLLAGSLAFAQATGSDSKVQKDPAGKTATKTKTKTKSHKGGKKGKKSSTTTPTTTPK